MTTQITDLPQQGVLAVRGKDAKTFLQGQLTCDLNLITPTYSTLGAQCNLQGRIHSLFRIIQSSNLDELAYYLMMPKTLLPKAIEGLKKYALFSKVVLEPLDDIAVLGVKGENVEDLLITDQTDMNWVCRVPGDVPRYEIYGKPNDIATLKGQLAQKATPIFSEVWDQWDIEQGLPALYPETMDQFLPHHIGLVELGGVSFDKGCYLGQEIVARMQWRGNIKKHLRKGIIAVDEMHTPKPGEKLYADPQQTGESIGDIVRVAQIEAHQYSVLFTLKDDTQPYYAQRSMTLIDV